MGFITDFLLLDLADYENLGIQFPLGLFVTGLSVAMIAVLFVINHYKMTVTLLLRRLSRYKAFSEESAKTLAQLRLDTGSVRAQLKRSGRLTYIVKRVGEVKMSYDEYVKASKKKDFKDEKIDFSSARFYIPADRLGDAQKALEKPTENWLFPIILSVAIIGLWFVLALFLEDLVSILNARLK